MARIYVTTDGHPIVYRDGSVLDSGLTLREKNRQDACMDVCRTCEHSAPPFGYCDLLSQCSRGPKYLAMLRSGNCPENKWPAETDEKPAKQV
jgi:hypothetical protein